MKKLLLLSLLVSALSVSGQQIGSNKAQLLAEASSSVYAVADGDTLVIPG